MAGMNQSELFGLLGSLRKANLQGGARAPHKPLLLLWVLGQIRSGKNNEFRYEDLEEKVSHLIDEFGPSSADRYRAAMPFFHLEDDIWKVDGTGELAPKRAVLIKNHAVGHLAPEVMTLLESNSSLIDETARFLIESHFTDSYVDPILSAVGLDPLAQHGQGFVVELDQKKRDPKFRSLVLTAWRKQCAMCGYDGEIGHTSVGLEAAHVKWFSQGGPDSVDNGLALCELHHALFDLGVLGITNQYRIVIAEDFIGKSDSTKRLVYDLHDAELLEPAPNKPMPSQSFLDWHLAQVFRQSKAS
jgi:putative restriction endonuclease